MSALAERGIDLKAPAAGAMTGERYRKRLQDGREVWIDGERVQDVTTHPAFKDMIDALANVYDLQTTKYRDEMTFVDQDSGVRTSVSWLLPRNPEELRKKRRNSELWSELTWGRLDSVESIVAVGDEVDVVVLEVHRGKPKISLSLRATRPDPFAAVQVGSVVPATVVLVVDYGVFVRLDDGGAEGLVHISELSDVPGYRPEQLVVPGEQLMVKVLDLDLKRRRLSLSVRRVLVDD